MLDGIDALVALETFGTVSEAAVRLRLTQSAVSKRLQALQGLVGFRLVAPQGRRLRLTPEAVAFLDRTRPLVAELRAAVRPRPAGAPASFSLALADSIASSWGPGTIRQVLASVPGLRLELHAHRSVLVLESVRLGRYDAGLCSELPSAKDLVQDPIVDEPMVLTGRHLKAPLITIEQTSATWRAILPALRELHPDVLARELLFVESFGAVLQMARAGFGDGLLPLGFAAAMGVRRFHALRGVTRRVCLMTRKSLALEPAFIAFQQQLVRELRTRRAAWQSAASP
jgi:DNA-binding transcriptional LysR family regulator